LRKQHVEGAKTLIAPDLLVYEISNALKFKPNFNPEITGKAVEDLYDLQIDLMVPNKELMVNCTGLAFKYGITACESIYLAIGEFLGIRVITADTQFYKKAKDWWFSLFVVNCGRSQIELIYLGVIRRFTKSSTLIPASVIICQRVPFLSVLCNGTVSLRIFEVSIFSRRT
jgi:predicted nucleic acid-binding protein